ncbi:hypothetical protein [Streptomyces sp. TRM49041]|uniref:hypothetical protein n=1 Tax=Streptomyces sp. TRM49041 TaxID=2603216 RepID=UPI0011F08165|nr:hypothetical protein [Streptomyces sp. TRM49041]
MDADAVAGDGSAGGRDAPGGETLAEDVRRLLEGAVIRSVGRAASMGVVELTGPHGEDLRVHIQCAFRFLRDRQILLGSRDMTYARDDAGPDAFDTFSTVYDARGALLTRVLAGARPQVEHVRVGDGGTLVLEASRGFRIEAFPDCSSPEEEAWQAFERGGPHYGYPSDVI